MFQNMDPQLSSLKTNGLDHSWPPLFGDIYICFVGLSRDHMDQLKSIFLIRVIPWQQFQQFSNPAHMTLCDYVTYLVTLYITGHLVQC